MAFRFTKTALKRPSISTMMSVIQSRYCTASLLLCLICFLVIIHSGTSLSSSDITKLSRREALKRLPLVASIGFGSLLSVELLPSQAQAADFQDDLRSSLKPASDDQPRIPLPTSQDAQSETTVVEGLLSLKNPKSELRPTASDIVLLTVRDVKHPDIVLAGAKLPISRVRFPLRFKLSTANLKGAKEAAIWKESASQHDLLVQAVVCSPESLTTSVSASTTCSDARFQAQGVAKLLRLQDNDVTIRSAVSLPLSFNTAGSD